MCNAVEFLSKSKSWSFCFFFIFIQIRLRFVLIEKSDFEMGAQKVLLLPRYVLKQYKKNAFWTENAILTCHVQKSKGTWPCFRKVIIRHQLEPSWGEDNIKDLIYFFPTTTMLAVANVIPCVHVLIGIT